MIITSKGSVLKVFISWSGERSKAVATQVKQWVGQVFQGTEVFMSDEDIMAGTNWSERIKSELANTTVGIICMTPENQDAKWINFEMGALSKEVRDGDTRVIPLLIGFNSTQQVGQPAASLNMVMLNKDGLRKIAYSLNQVMENKREQSAIDLVTDMWWKELSASIETAAGELPTQSPPERSERAMVEEILETVRIISKYQPAVTSARKAQRPRQVSRSLHSVVSDIIGDVGGEMVTSDDGISGFTVKTARALPEEVCLSVVSTVNALEPSTHVVFGILDERDYEFIREAEARNSD